MTKSGRKTIYGDVSNEIKKLTYHNRNGCSQRKQGKIDDKTLLLDLVKGDDVTALDIIVGGFCEEMLLDEAAHRDEVVHDGENDLQLLDRIPHWSQLRCQRTGKRHPLDNY